MSLAEFITIYLLILVFRLWVARCGGAEWLEGTFLSGFQVNIFAPKWSAGGIKLFAYGTLIITTTTTKLFVLGLLLPDSRLFF